MIDPASSESLQIKFVYEWDQGFLDKNLDRLAKGLHEDFRYIMHPQSLGRTEKNREEWLGYVAGVFNASIVFPSATYHSILEAPGKVVTHVTGKVKGQFGADTVDRESMYIIDIITDEDGLKIKRIQEFTDSKLYLDLTKAATAATEANARDTTSFAARWKEAKPELAHFEGRGSCRMHDKRTD